MVGEDANLGPVVQSIVSLTSLLRGQLVKCFTILFPNTLIIFVEKMKNFCTAKASCSFSTNKRAMMALGHSPEYHWNQIISKSVHRFSRRSLLKLFSICSPGGHFVQPRGTV